MNRRLFFSILGVVLLLHVAFFWYISDKPVKVRTSTSRPIPPRSFFSAKGVYDDPAGDGKLVVREFTVSTKLEELPAEEGNPTPTAMEEETKPEATPTNP